MATEEMKKRPAVFVKISSLRPDTAGHNLKLKVRHEILEPNLRLEQYWEGKLREILSICNAAGGCAMLLARPR